MRLCKYCRFRPAKKDYCSVRCEMAPRREAKRVKAGKDRSSLDHFVTGSELEHIRKIV